MNSPSTFGRASMTYSNYNNNKAAPTHVGFLRRHKMRATRRLAERGRNERCTILIIFISNNVYRSESHQNKQNDDNQHQTHQQTCLLLFIALVPSAHTTLAIVMYSSIHLNNKNTKPHRFQLTLGWLCHILETLQIIAMTCDENYNNSLSFFGDEYNVMTKEVNIRRTNTKQHKTQIPDIDCHSFKYYTFDRIPSTES